MNIVIAVATFAYIVNDQQKVLLVRRAKNDSFPGRWELQGGGLDSGERPEESIEREVLEETGLRVNAVRPISVITHNNQDNSKEIVRITYECNLVNQNEKVQLSKEHDAYQWVNIDEINKLGKNTPLYYVIKEINTTFTPSI